MWDLTWGTAFMGPASLNVPSGTHVEDELEEAVTKGKTTAVHAEV